MKSIAIPVVLFAGILWSFGPLVVRYMDQPELSTMAISYLLEELQFLFY